MYSKLKCFLQNLRLSKLTITAPFYARCCNILILYKKYSFLEYFIKHEMKKKFTPKHNKIVPGYNIIIYGKIFQITPQNSLHNFVRVSLAITFAIVSLFCAIRKYF